VSKHIKVLERAGLVERGVLGRDHYISLTPSRLSEASAWIDAFRVLARAFNQRMS
jgi:DNA-binding MarR family transcriptional regulator